MQNYIEFLSPYILKIACSCVIHRPIFIVVVSLFTSNTVLVIIYYILTNMSMSKNKITSYFTTNATHFMRNTHG